MAPSFSIPLVASTRSSATLPSHRAPTSQAAVAGKVWQIVQRNVRTQLIALVRLIPTERVLSSVALAQVRRTTLVSLRLFCSEGVSFRPVPFLPLRRPRMSQLIPFLAPFRSLARDSPLHCPVSACYPLHLARSQQHRLEQA